MIANNWHDYEVIATGNGEKLERWGGVYLLRPDPQVIWTPPYDLSKEKNLNAHYFRDSEGGGKWRTLKKFPEEWTVKYKDLKFLIKPMGFKHTGLFPEQAVNWDICSEIIKKSKEEVKVLNLFGYTGGASVACAKAGAFVTHVDAAKGMVDRCKQNAQLSAVAPDKIRYIVDDCKKFVQREIKRGKKYNAVIMDPPSYGRGPNGEVWKIEDNLQDLLELVVQVLDKPVFFLINSYTTGLQPTVINNMLTVAMSKFKGKANSYEVCLPISDKSRGELLLPCGCSGLWQREE